MEEDKPIPQALVVPAMDRIQPACTQAPSPSSSTSSSQEQSRKKNLLHAILDRIAAREMGAVVSAMWSTLPADQLEKVFSKWLDEEDKKRDWSSLIYGQTSSLPHSIQEDQREKASGLDVFETTSSRTVQFECSPKPSRTESRNEHECIPTNFPSAISYHRQQIGEEEEMLCGIEAFEISPLFRTPECTMTGMENGIVHTSDGQEVSFRFLAHPLEEMFGITEESVFQDAQASVVGILHEVRIENQVAERHARAVVRAVKDPIDASMSEFIRQNLPGQVTTWPEIPTSGLDAAGQFLSSVTAKLCGENELVVEEDQVKHVRWERETEKTVGSWLIPETGQVAVMIIESLRESSCKNIKEKGSTHICFKNFLEHMGDIMRCCVKGPKRTTLKENSRIVELEKVPDDNVTGTEATEKAASCSGSLPSLCPGGTILSSEDLTRASYAVRELLVQTASDSNTDLHHILLSGPHITAETFDMVKMVARDIESAVDSLDHTSYLKEFSQRTSISQTSLLALNSAVSSMYKTVDDKMSTIFHSQTSEEDLGGVRLSDLFATTSKASALCEKLSKTSLSLESGNAAEVYNQHVDNSTKAVIAHLALSVSSLDIPTEVTSKIPSKLSVEAVSFVNEIVSFVGNSDMSDAFFRPESIPFENLQTGARENMTGKKTRSEPNVSIPALVADLQAEAVKAMSETLIRSATDPTYLEVISILNKQAASQSDAHNIKQHEEQGKETATGIIELFMHYIDRLKRSDSASTESAVSKTGLTPSQGSLTDSESEPDDKCHILPSAVLNFYHNTKMKVNKFLSPHPKPIIESTLGPDDCQAMAKEQQNVVKMEQSSLSRKKIVHSQIGPDTITTLSASCPSSLTFSSRKDMPSTSSVITLSGGISPEIHISSPASKISAEIIDNSRAVAKSCSTSSLLRSETVGIAAAKTAMSTAMEKMLVTEEQPPPAEKDLEIFLSHSILRPYTDKLVDQIISFLLANASLRTSSVPSKPKYKSMSVLPNPRTTDDIKRELSREGLLEIAYAFTEANLRKLLNDHPTLLCPPSAAVELSGAEMCHSDPRPVASKDTEAQGCSSPLSCICGEIIQLFSRMVARKVTEYLYTDLKDTCSCGKTTPNEPTN